MNVREIIAGTVLCIVVPLGAAAQELALDWSEPMEEGQVLEVRGIISDISVTRASGGTARVVAEKAGRRSDFDLVEVHVVRERDGYTVCVAYVDRMDPDDPCDWNDDRRDRGGHGERHVRAGIDFEVQLPEGVELITSTVTGDVDATGLRSDVSASSVSGDVHVTTSGVVRASTVSGSLEIEMGSDAWDDLHFSTVSGDITLYLPAGIETEVEFESLSGDLRTDFDMEVEERRKRFVGSRVRGQIGSAERSLSFRTVSGDVRIYGVTPR